MEWERSIKAGPVCGPVRSAGKAAACLFASFLSLPSHAQESAAVEAAQDATASLTAPSGEGLFNDLSLPNNPNAIDQCLAKVRVESARLRATPSLSGEIVGMRTLDQSVFVHKVMGKWAQVTLANGDTAYIAAYLLVFSWQDLLEQWKKGAPQPTVGKKAKVKWVMGGYSPPCRDSRPARKLWACFLFSNAASSA